MSILRILDTTGDTELEFDVQTGTNLAEATQLFTDMVKAGYLAYAIRDGKRDDLKDKVIIYDFDPKEEEILMTPMLRGG